jgi:hypothetical protein
VKYDVGDELPLYQFLMRADKFIYI